MPPWFSLIVCLPLLLGVMASAQDPQKGDRVPPGSQSQRNEPTFRVTVRLVNVFTTVTDSRGAPVANLTKEDFHTWRGAAEEQERARVGAISAFVENEHASGVYEVIETVDP